MAEDYQNDNLLISYQSFSVSQIFYSVKHLQKSKAFMAENCQYDNLLTGY